MTAPHKPTVVLKRKVTDLASCGVNRDIIAAYIGINKDTFLKYYKDVFETAKTDRNAMVGNKLFELCMKGNVTAIIFWLKTQGAWKEDETVDKAEQMKDAVLESIAERLPN